MDGSGSKRQGGRERLLQAAGELFAQRSYGDVGVAELLSRAGVQAPTLYHHFDDKESLYVAWAEGAFTELGRLVRDKLRGVDARAGLVGILEAIGGYRGLNLLTVLADVPKLAKPDHGERIIRAYFDAVYEPCCVAILNAADERLIRLEEIGPMTGMFLMGGLGSMRRYGLPATNADDAYSWFVDRFVRAFAP